VPRDFSCRTLGALVLQFVLSTLLSVDDLHAARIRFAMVFFRVWRYAFRLCITEYFQCR
jgi:hypothetical protein